MENNTKIAVGLIPCLNHYFLTAIWDVVKPYVEKIAETTKGEYDIYKVWQDIYFGQAHLYVGYEIQDEGVTQDKFQEVIMKCLQTPSVNFFGYAIIRFEPKNAHIWQSYVLEKYQSTDIVEKTFQYIEKVVKDVGAPAITFSTHRHGWAKICEKLGFGETYTVYRKELK